jgi:hypothetical protein
VFHPINQGMNNCAVFGNIAQYFDYMKNRRGRQGGLPVNIRTYIEREKCKIEKGQKKSGQKILPGRKLFAVKYYYATKIV